MGVQPWIKKKSLEMNIVDISQIINMNSLNKIINRFSQTFDKIMISNCRSYKKFKKFVLPITIYLIIKNHWTHDNHDTSQQR